MSKKIDTKNFDKQKMIEWRKRVGVGPLMWATTIDNANDKINKLTAEKKDKEAYDVKIDVERKLCIVDTNAILAMSKSSLEYDRKLAKRKANYVFVDLIRLATSEFETPAEMDNSGLKTLYSNYKAIKSIQKEHENSIIPKMKKLVEVLFYLGTQTKCDKNEVALTMADVYRIIEAKVFTGLTITEGKTEEEKKAIYDAPDVKEHFELLSKNYADEPFDIYRENGHFKTTLEINKLINLALYLVREGLITLEDIQSGIEGLASQFIFIWNGYDLANTVDIAHAILEGQIKILDLSKENFNVEGVDTNIQSIKDADTLLKLLDTAQKYIVNDLRKETLTPILRRFKKFNRNVPVEKDGIDLVSPLADTFDGYLDTYIKIAVPSIKELHDRIVCNYGDKVEMEEKIYNDKGEEETKKVSKVVKLNTKMCIASIITLLFIDRLLHIPDFLRGIEVIFSGFLDLTSVTWEEFAKKLDEVINAIDFNVDEAIVEEYERLANIKIKDHSTEEVKEEIDDENAKEAITKTIPNHLKEIDDAIMRGDLKIAPRYVKDEKGNIKFTGADVVTVTDTLKKTVKNTHGEDVPAVSGKCNVEEELDKGNAVQVTENTVIVPQDKSEEY